MVVERFAGEVPHGRCSCCLFGENDKGLTHSTAMLLGDDVDTDN